MATASTQRRAGAELGSRFTDVQVLRAGSRFTIYGAWEPAAARRVVLKVPDHGSPWLDDVTEQEARVLAAIGSHPYVVTMYERVGLDDGRPALLLEHCVGTLYDTVNHDEDTMSVRDVVATGIKLAGALETLHRTGMLHCDVRPRTVLVTEFGEPALGGFDEVVEMTRLGTRPPLHNLTPHTAPELLEGAEPSPASDVYGLASTLYELAAGRTAFRAYVGESPASVIVRVLSSRAKPVVAPQVPLELTDLIAWAMSPDPVKRPPSPSWLAEELGHVEARQGWPRTRFVSG